MKNIISVLPVLFVLMFHHNSYAQSPIIDSLNKLISTAGSDTARIELFIKKSKQLGIINLDSSMLFAKQALQQANRINYRKGQIALISIISSGYAKKSDFESAEENLATLKQLVKTSKDSIEIANMYGAYGDVYCIQGRYDTSTLLLLNAVRIIEAYGYTSSLGQYYGDLGIIYQQQADYSQALFYQQSVLKLADKENDAMQQAKTLVNIAGTYSDMGDIEKSNQIYHQAIVLAEKFKFLRVEIYAYSNLSSNLTQQEKWKESYSYALKAAALAATAGDLPIQGASLSKAAKAAAEMGRFDEATKLAKQSISMADSVGTAVIISQAYSSMGSTLRMQKKYREALPFIEKAVAVLNPQEFNEFKGTLYWNLLECYEATGNTAAALMTFRKYDENKDSTRSRDNIQRATELSMNYEFDKKQAVAKAEQARKDAETKRIKNQQIFTILALGVIVLAVLIIALIQYRNNRHKEKANTLLQGEKRKVENALSELKLTQAQLIQSEKMASLGMLTAGIAHEIQNPLNFVNNFSDVNNEMIDEAAAEIEKGNIMEAKSILNDIKENEKKISHHGKRADSIIKGMLQHSRASKGQKELTDINALADEYLDLSYHGLKAKNNTLNVSLQKDFDKSIGKINIMPQDIGRVLLNLYNNAVYSVSEKKKSSGVDYEPTVSVCTKKINRKVEIRIKDNGHGISQKLADKIFNPFFTTKPTGEGTGLGLSLSYDIIKAHGGDIKVESTEGEFAEFTILLPLAV